LILSLLQKGFSKILLLFILSAIVLRVASSQVTGFYQNFNSGDISNWGVDSEQQPIFQVSANINVLMLSCTKTLSRWGCGNIHFTSPAVINVLSNPIITIRLRSIVDTVFS
jgi:hypothetical protein